jgi:serine/threonine-protein kinase
VVRQAQASAESAARQRTTRIEGSRAARRIGPCLGPAPGSEDLARLLSTTRYMVVRPLGSGGMGEVYEAEDRVAHERLALKVLADRLAHRPHMAARMLEEARALGRVRHPNVVVLRASGALPDGRPFLAMELLRGQTLEAAARGSVTLSVRTAVRCVRDLLHALGAVHRAGLAHCDVKPSNVFVCEDGTVKLLDFGAAERTLALESWQTSCPSGPSVGNVGLVSRDSPAARSLASPSAVDGSSGSRQRGGSGTVLGTPRYMAPERRAGEPATERCDLYGVGLVLEELLAARDARSPGLLGKRCSPLEACSLGPLGRARGCRATGACALLSIARRASAASPAARFASALQMERALQEAFDACSAAFFS